MSTRREFLRTLALGLAAPAVGPALAHAGQALTRGRITLLHTNDTHSRMDPFPAGAGRYAGRAGVARRGAIIRAVRAANPSTLVLDAGDFFQGTPYFNRFRGEVEVRAMSALGYDAVTLGNHEFDLGVEALARALEHRRFDVVSSNYEITNPALTGLVQRTHVYQVGGVRVGVFGLGVALDGLANPRSRQGVRYGDPIEAARAAVDELRGARGAQLVVALSHLGHRGVLGEPGDLHWPEQVPGVDYVVGGHSHTFLDAPARVRHPASGWETLVMQVGFAGLNLGRADFVIEDGRARLQAISSLGVGGHARAA